MARVAAIDVGTNTVLASIVAREGNDRDARLVWDGARITRLGQGVGASRRLRDDAIARTIEAVSALAAEARARGAERVVGVGTSALRDAENRETFVVAARSVLDGFEVISGEREAELTFRGAFVGLTRPEGAVTVVDIGGGSTEIVRGEGGHVTARVSVDVGSVRLSERHGVRDEAPSPARLAAIRADVARAMEHVPVAPPLVMLAGTATNVAAVARGIDLAGGAPQPHGLRVDAAALGEAVARITAVGRAERARLVGIEPGREDVIVAGALIFEHVLARAAAPEVTISDGGVRLGLALALLDAQG